MNNMQVVLDYFSKYGMWFLFIIVYLEYLNLPGLPAGIIMPAAGILVRTSGYNFGVALVVSVIAGLLGSYSLYFVGFKLGGPAIDKLCRRYPKLTKSIDKANYYTERYGDRGIIISRLIPVARTLISLVAGVFQTNFMKFTIYSVIGITGWNFVFIFSGYFFMHMVL
ncbi:MAG: DedA family protein [Cellulosilyticaceae bacterium]